MWTCNLSPESSVCSGRGKTTSTLLCFKTWGVWNRSVLSVKLYLPLGRAKKRKKRKVVVQGGLKWLNCADPDQNTDSSAQESNRPEDTSVNHVHKENTQFCSVCRLGWRWILHFNILTCDIAKVELFYPATNNKTRSASKDLTFDFTFTSPCPRMHHWNRLPSSPIG